jgi:CheY-like chemotaxis protein
MADVLIVDDEQTNRVLLATLLRHAGHTPLEASNGRDALTMAKEIAPALVIVDLSLSDISGVEVLRELRSDPRTNEAKIALYTATQPGAALDELSEMYRINAVIPKPGDPREVLALLRDLLAP